MTRIRKLMVVLSMVLALALAFGSTVSANGGKYGGRGPAQPTGVDDGGIGP